MNQGSNEREQKTEQKGEERCARKTQRARTQKERKGQKLIANVNDGKHKRKSHKSQKGENEHKKLKSFDCNPESKATEQPKPTTETAEQEQGWAKERRPKAAESKKPLIGTRLWLSDRK
jgi:hypothetical protein